MNPLDNESIEALCKALAPANKPLPFAIRSPATVVVSNQSLLMEWPIDLVDIDCSKLSKLLDNQKSDHFAETLAKIKAQGWVDALFDDAGKYVATLEVGPNDGDLGHSQIIYTYRKKRTQYGYFNFDVTELFIDYPEYKLYRAPEGEEVGMPPQFRPLIIYEEGRMVGVFMNDFPR